jgi:hypothetical protein
MAYHEAIQKALEDFLAEWGDTYGVSTTRRLQMLAFDAAAIIAPLVDKAAAEARDEGYEAGVKDGSGDIST